MVNLLFQHQFKMLRNFLGISVVDQLTVQILFYKNIVRKITIAGLF